MARREILLKGDERLTKICHPVVKFDRRLGGLLDDMKDTLVHANGAGLAAPQVGILRRIFIVDNGEKITEYINPEILETSEFREVYEGCLSLPGMQGVIMRPAHARIRAQDRHGKFFEAEGTGIEAQAFCHENDHLDGILFDTKMIRAVEKEKEE